MKKLLFCAVYLLVAVLMFAACKDVTPKPTQTPGATIAPEQSQKPKNPPGTPDDHDDPDDPALPMIPTIPSSPITIYPTNSICR